MGNDKFCGNITIYWIMPILWYIFRKIKNYDCYLIMLSFEGYLRYNDFYTVIITDGKHRKYLNNVANYI